MYLSVVYGSTCTSETPSGAIVTLACLVKGLCAVVFKMVPLLLFYANSSASFFFARYTPTVVRFRPRHIFFYFCLSSYLVSGSSFLTTQKYAEGAFVVQSCAAGN